MKSFDFFDTLFTRDLYKPEDIFYFVGKAAKDKNLLNVDPYEFKNIRIKAESIARKKSKYEEITIDDIYYELGELLRISDSEIIESIKNLELTIEEKSLIPIEENIKKLDSDSLIISDTYLNKDFLAHILTNNKIKCKSIITSSEYKKTKYSGSLYDEVLKYHDLKEHIGDNIRSDYYVPIRKKLGASLYFRSKPSRYEELVYNSSITYENKFVFSGAMKATRLAKYYEDEHLQTIHEISSNVVAPFLFCYVHWVLKKATELKIDSLYFISRDGQILFEITKCIKQFYRMNINLRYLYGSRKAWHLPAITEITNDVLDWIFDNTYFLSLEDICKRAEIDVNDVKKILNLNIPENKNLNQNERKILKEEFTKNTEIHKLILESARKKKEIAIEYLKQEGFSKFHSIGIVDVGWRGRQQVSLSKLLDMGGIYPNDGIVGFYLYLMNPIKQYLNDRFITFFEGEKYAFLLRYPAIIESFVAADHGSCIGYEKKGNKIFPLLREKENFHILNWGLKIQHDAILNFSRILLENLIKYRVSLNEEHLISELILNLFLSNPLKKETYVYSKIRVFEDQEETKEYSICETISRVQILKFIARKNPFHHALWIEGSIKLSFNEIEAKIFLKILKSRALLKKLIVHMLRKLRIKVKK